MKRFYHNLSTRPAVKNTKFFWHDLHGSSISLAIATIAKRQECPIVVITKDLQVATKLSEEIAFFLNLGNDSDKNRSKNYSDQNKNSDSDNAQIPILNFPDWEILPYDHFSPHQDITSQRLAALNHLPTLQQGILITAINTIMHRLSPRTHIEHSSFALKCGDKLEINNLRYRLEKQGYNCVSKVMEHGEFAVRGSLIDLFPMGSDYPYRIDLFDQLVDSMRTFDPETQLTTTKINEIKLLPAKEFPLTGEAISHFRQDWRTNFSGDPTNCPIYQGISNGESPGGIEYYLPLFFPKLASFFDYLPPNSLIITIEDVHSSAINFWAKIKHRHSELQHDTTYPLLSPNDVFLPVTEIFNQLKLFPQIHVLSHPPTQTPIDHHIPLTNGVPVVSSEEVATNTKHITNTSNVTFAVSPLPTISIDHKTTPPLAKLATFINSFDGNILFCAESRGRLESLLELLQTIKVQPILCTNWQELINTISNNTTTTTKAHYITVGLPEKGFILHEDTSIPDTTNGFNSNNDATNNFALICETDIYGQQLVRQRNNRGQQKKYKYTDQQNIIRDFIELRPGAPVVHIEHGIGRYLGLQTITTDGIAAEFLTIEYTNKAKLYVPIGSLHLISRYTGTDSDHIPYNTLGTDKWEKAKRKAFEKIRDVAAELLALYAKRAAKPGFSCKLPSNDYQKFVEAFPFEETEDQKTAIDAVINSMTAPHHMDHLICGDVGFGKTEVAMRATFIAVNNGKQVSILVPTTILAQQHYLNFKDRFADWPVNIELLTRARSAKEQVVILEKLKNGKIDIVIGTHKLLQPDIKFKDLGLLIIDEEHRFGVKQKERIKELRPEVDLLTLTATPIPRTLNMAFVGIRDFSIIATPPARRLAIKTFIHERETAIIREAIWREILRGGQVYFLHNDVTTIEKTAHELLQLIPTIRVAVAHGQMREQQLERIMSDFYHLRFNVLVCTTIVESGIDVPTANTIIIDRADRFGLAQLHQLRGRVGRSHHQAYAYLLVPSKKSLTQDAARRLEAITLMEDLGAGFSLATHDLEIRGAGELLGAEQSGHIESIGFSLYLEYLENAIKALKEGHDIQLNNELSGLAEHRPEIEIKIPALFHEEYINDVNTRLTLYKRLANIRNNDELITLREEIIDRFGVLPTASKNLFRITELKLIAEKLGIRKIVANNHGGTITFTTQPKIDPIKVIKLIQQQSQTYKLKGPDKLSFLINQNQDKKNKQQNDQTSVQTTTQSSLFLLDFIAKLLGELDSVVAS